MSWRNQYELIEWPLRDAPTSIHVFFLLLSLYLITVTFILEISLGSCWHKDECMSQRSTIHHYVQIFISLNNQHAIIQWLLLDAPTSTQGVFTTLSLSKYCLLRLCRKQYGHMLAERYIKGQRCSINHKIKLFCKLVQLLKYMCKLYPYQISITIWKFTTWVCIEHEDFEIATSTRKHWLVYGIYQS